MMDVENEKSAVSWALFFDWEIEMATKLSFELVLDPSVRPGDLPRCIYVGPVE